MADAPFLVDASEAARLVGLSRSKFYSELSAGRIGPAPIKFGKASRFNREELLEWVRAGAPSRERWRNCYPRVTTRSPREADHG